ncbi:MAG: hypothetical protein LUD84_10555 [Clostridiales bacterium]|nr:hypothetical protein [Clostridiales bacterium]
MKKTIDQYWLLLSTYCKLMDERGVPVSIREEKKTDYRKAVESRCQSYKESYMKSGTKELDRHKVAAIMVVEGLKCKVIDSSKINGKLESGAINIGAEKVLLASAFDFMTAVVNQILDEARNTDPEVALERFPGFAFPEAWSCDTDFMNIMSRTLYYANSDDSGYKLNEMELAEKFFILEYSSILSLFPKEKDKYFQILKKAGTKNVQTK